MSDNLGDFLAEIDRLEAQVPTIHRDAQVALLALGYQVAIDNTPRKTGALRAENIVVLGSAESPQAILYEHPDRPGPDEPVPYHGAEIFSPPSVADARVALSNVEPFQELSVINQRFYAPAIHTGEREWMNHASDYVELIADAFPVAEWK